MRTPNGSLPLKICHVQALPHMTGVQRAMLELFKHLDRSRFAPTVVCQHAGRLTEELERIGIPFHLIPELGRAIAPRKDFKAYRKLHRYFQQERFALVHSHSSKPGILARIAARRAGIPAVFHHVQGFAFHEFSSNRARLIYSQLERFAGRYCDRVIFVNNEEREMAVERKLLPTHKAVAIHNGIDLNDHHPWRHQDQREQFRQERNLEEDEIAILVLGRLEPQKNPLMLPKIATHLETLMPDRKWRLLLAGEGELEAEVKREVSRLQLGHRIEFLGWREDPSLCIHGSDLMLLPSLWEGLPLTLAEAQAAGLPCVASDIKGNREVIGKQTGFLCPPLDAESYANRLALLISETALRKQMGASSRERAELLFDSQRNNLEIIRLYEECLGLSTTTAKPLVHSKAA